MAGVMSSSPPVNSGVREACVLAPTLFNTYVAKTEISLPNLLLLFSALYTEVLPAKAYQEMKGKEKDKKVGMDQLYVFMIDFSLGRGVSVGSSFPCASKEEKVD